IAPGIYTLRKLTQPEDGDHLGVSETRDFVVLCPAKSDKTPDPLTERQAVKLSTEVSGSKHPAILYLVKPFDEPKGLPRVYEDEDLGFWIVDVLLPEAPNEGAAARAAESSTEPEKPEAGDKSKRTVRVALVLVGKAVEF
ncbi:MAG TPA: hypothetical protein VK116_11870, partial [Planctomycetota bacterium]|nr:hypothetical protein [Planctomycetota bacterium]